MARTLLVAGTASHVGKSTVAAGLCRYLADRGVDVVPFKAQNMSNNARVVPRADAGGAGGAVVTPEGGAADGGTAGDRTDDRGTAVAWGEIGVSQYVQATAARTPPTTDVNPVLLKPRGDGESQLVIGGEAVAHLPAGEYYDEHWDRALDAARAAHDRLAGRHDVVVAEGAGSIAEVNLHDRDLANVETARFADADVLLVADVDRGGAFASIVGTLDLMPADVREQVVGCVITKFRGDRDLLAPGLETVEERTGVPVLGVLPHDDPGLPEEDSVALPPVGERGVRGDDDGLPADRAVTVAVPRLPRLSNATDLAPLARTPGVRVAYVPLDASLDGADAVVLPGTKNTVDDLLALREVGFHETLRAFDGPAVGLCGGYQLLGEAITGADLEGTGDREEVSGIGLLPVRTRFSPEKTVVAVERELDGVGPLAGASGAVRGYEIHAGDTEFVGDGRTDVERPFPESNGATGAATDEVLGTYLHGLFENEVAREAFVDAVYRSAGRERPRPAPEPEGQHDGDVAAERPCDRAAALIDEYVDLAPLGR